MFSATEHITGAHLRYDLSNNHIPCSLASLSFWGANRRVEICLLSSRCVSNTRKRTTVFVSTTIRRHLIFAQQLQQFSGGCSSNINPHPHEQHIRNGIAFQTLKSLSTFPLTGCFFHLSLSTHPYVCRIRLLLPLPYIFDIVPGCLGADHGSQFNVCMILISFSNI